MEGPRRDAPLQLPPHLAALFLGDAPAGLHGVGEHRLKRLAVQVPLVDHQLADRRHRGDDASRRRDRADRRDTPRRLGDAPCLEHEARRRGHRVAPHVHGRRSDVGALAAEADDVALDAVRPEYDRQGQVEALEHRALLDVQLQVGGGTGELPARVSRTARGRLRARRARRGVRRPRHRAGRGRGPDRGSAKRRSSRTGCDRSGSLPRRPSPRAAPSRAERPSAASRRSTSSPPSTFRQPSSQPPFETESRWPPITHGSLGGARKRRPEVAGRVRLDAHGQRLEPLAVPAAGARPGLGPAHPLGPVRVAGECPELAQLGNGAGGIERHGGQP